MNTFLRTACSAVVVLALAALLAACSAPVPGGGPAPGAQFGDLRVGLSTFARADVDPPFSGPSVAYLLGAAIFDSLVEVTGDGKVAPGLAERWEMSPDGKTWTFHIRKGVKFHDGSDLTAADIKFSIERVLKPDATSIYAAKFRSTVAAVEQPDDYTAVLRLKQAEPEFWRYLVPLLASEGLISPKKYIEDKGVEYFRDHMVGSGPWKFVKYDINTELQLEAVSQHWRYTPKFKKLTITKVPDESTRLAMLRVGQLDMIDVSTANAAEVKAAGLRLIEYPRASGSALALMPDPKNLSAHPIGDLRVRKALSLAINRQEIANTIFAGYAAPSRVAGQGGAYVDPDLKPDAYDPVEAKRLLAEAGYSNGFSLDVYSARTAVWTDLVSEAVSGYWDKVGVKAKIKIQDFAVLNPLIQQASPQLRGSAIVNLSQNVPTFNVDGYSAKGYYKNQVDAQVDALVEKTAGTVDPAEREKVGRQAIKAAKEAYTILGLVDIADLYGVGPAVGEWALIRTPLGSMPAQEYARMPHGK